MILFPSDLCDVPPQNGLRPCNDSYLVKESTCSLDGCAPAGKERKSEKGERDWRTEEGDGEENFSMQSA